jgi:hypothetical protein
VADPIVGIDLGTSNTVIAHADAAGAVRVLSDEAGFKIHPSVVSFHPSGGVVVGAAAKQRKVIDPANTIYSVKRLIGRPWGSPEVQSAKKRAPYTLKEGANQQPLIVTRGGEFAVPEISAIVLDHVRNLASTQLDAQVEIGSMGCRDRVEAEVDGREQNRSQETRLEREGEISLVLRIACLAQSREDRRGEEKGSEQVHCVVPLFESMDKDAHFRVACDRHFSGQDEA